MSDRQRILERDERSRDCDVIAAAVESMKAVAAHINEMKARHEQVVRTQEISSVLHDWHGPDISIAGHVVLEVGTAKHERNVRDTVLRVRRTCTVVRVGRMGLYFRFSLGTVLTFSDYQRSNSNSMSNVFQLAFVFNQHF